MSITLGYSQREYVGKGAATRARDCVGLFWLAVGAGLGFPADIEGEMMRGRVIDEMELRRKG